MEPKTGSTHFEHKIGHPVGFRSREEVWLLLEAIFNPVSPVRFRLIAKAINKQKCDWEVQNDIQLYALETVV